MDLQTLINLVPATGTTGLLVYYIVASWKGWIISKREYMNEVKRRKEIEKERNDWRELALRGTHLAEDLVNVKQRRFFEEQ